MDVSYVFTEYTFMKTSHNDDWDVFFVEDKYSCCNCSNWVKDDYAVKLSNEVSFVIFLYSILSYVFNGWHHDDVICFSDTTFRNIYHYFKVLWVTVSLNVDDYTFFMVIE